MKTSTKYKTTKYVLKVTGARINKGCNDFQMRLLKFGTKIVPGYTFVVGRDVANGRKPYVGKAKISKRILSRKRISMGSYQSNIFNGNNCAIHAGRGTHRWITWGCIRMNEQDFKKLFDFLQQFETDNWGWFNNVFIEADPIISAADPEQRVPKQGNMQ